MSVGYRRAPSFYSSCGERAPLFSERRAVYMVQLQRWLRIFVGHRHPNTSKLGVQPWLCRDSDGHRVIRYTCARSKRVFVNMFGILPAVSLRSLRWKGISTDWLLRLCSRCCNLRQFYVDWQQWIADARHPFLAYVLGSASFLTIWFAYHVALPGISLAEFPGIIRATYAWEDAIGRKNITAHNLEEHSVVCFHQSIRNGDSC